MWQKLRQLYWQYYWLTTACANIPQANDVNPARTVTDQGTAGGTAGRGRDSSHDVQHSYFPPTGPASETGCWPRGNLGIQT